MKKFWLVLLAPIVFGPLTGSATDTNASAGMAAASLGSVHSSLAMPQHVADASSFVSRDVHAVQHEMLSTASMLKPYDMLLMVLVLVSLAAFQLRRMQDSLHRPFADR